MDASGERIFIYLEGGSCGPSKSAVKPVVWRG